MSDTTSNNSLSITPTTQYTHEQYNDLRAELYRHVEEKQQLYDVIFKLRHEMESQSNEIELLKQQAQNIALIDKNIVDQCSNTNALNINSINTDTTRMSSKSKTESIQQLNTLLQHYHALYQQLLHRYTLQTTEMQHFQHMCTVQTDQLYAQQAELHRIDLLTVQNQQYTQDIQFYQTTLQQLNTQQHALTTQLSETQSQQTQQHAYNTHIEQLQKSITTLKSELNNIKQHSLTQINELHIHSTQQIQSLSDLLLADHSNTSKHTRSHTEPYINIQTDYQNLQAEYNTVKDTVDTLQIQLDELQCQNSDLLHDNQALQSKQAELLQSYQQLTKQNTTLLGHIDLVNQVTTKKDKSMKSNSTHTYDIIREMRRTSSDQLHHVTEHKNIDVQTDMDVKSPQQQYIHTLEAQIHILTQSLERNQLPTHSSQNSISRPQSMTYTKNDNFEEKSNTPQSSDNPHTDFVVRSVSVVSN